jgi:hypothetical protein
MTHLVEHLALPSQSRRRLDFNGHVDNILCSFWASGDDESVREFLAAITHRLSSLPLDRLETERQILLAEEATQGHNATRLSFALRYGPTGHGLTGYDEYGLRRLTVDEVSTWARSRFSRQNMAIWLNGGDPGTLELELGDGEHHLPQAAVPILEVAEALPCVYRGAPSGAVAFSIESERTTAFRAGLNVLVHRIQDRLRYELGLTYGVEGVFVPLTGTRVHVVLVSDATDQHAQRVCTEMLHAFDVLAHEGPAPEELEDELADARRFAITRSEVPSGLFYAATQHLLGQSSGVREHLAELEALTPADVAVAIGVARASILALVPESVGDVGGLRDYPISASHVITGKRYRPRGLKLRRADTDPVLVLGEDGVAIEASGSRTAVPYARCVAALRYADGSRTLISDDGFFLSVDPTRWKDGTGIVAALDAGVEPALSIPLEPGVERAESVERLADEKLNRRWVVSEELEQLPDRLEEGEEAITLCEATKGMRAGLLVATDRRVVFFSIIRRETWLEFPYAEITAVEGTEGMLDSNVRITTADGTVEFGAIAPKERTGEMVREIEARLGST